MIPLVMYPAAQGSWSEMWVVAAVSTLLTLGAMLVTVLLAVKGLRLLPIRQIESYTHAMAGAVVLSARVRDPVSRAVSEESPPN